MVLKTPFLGADSGAIRRHASTPYKTSTAAINIHQFNTPLAIAKPKDLKRLRRYGVSERKRQQIRVYCYENPGNPQRDAAYYFTDEPQVIKLNKALDALERLRLYKGQ